MKLGRPCEFKEEYIDRVDFYLKEHQDEFFDYTKSESNTGSSKERKIIVKLPTIEGFALYLGVNKTSLYEWEKKNEIFSNALDKIRIEQKKRLLDKGLSGDYNSTIAKLILSSNHGMSDRQDLDVTSKGEAIKGFNFVNPE